MRLVMLLAMQLLQAVSKLDSLFVGHLDLKGPNLVLEERSANAAACLAGPSQDAANNALWIDRELQQEWDTLADALRDPSLRLGSLQLSDFGCARALPADRCERLDVHNGWRCVGTKPYMPPEATIGELVPTLITQLPALHGQPEQVKVAVDVHANRRPEALLDCLHAPVVNVTPAGLPLRSAAHRAYLTAETVLQRKGQSSHVKPALRQAVVAAECARPEWRRRRAQQGAPKHSDLSAAQGFQFDAKWLDAAPHQACLPRDVGLTVPGQDLAATPPAATDVAGAITTTTFRKVVSRCTDVASARYAIMDMVHGPIYDRTGETLQECQCASVLLCM